MFELSDFYRHCRQQNIEVIPYAGCPGAGATVRDAGNYAIFLDFSKVCSTRLLRGVCVHELGHAATGALHKVSSPYEMAERSEYRANRWVAEHYLTEQELREAFAAGAREVWELAEYFDFPEADVKKALTYWTERRGVIFDT